MPWIGFLIVILESEASVSLLFFLSLFVEDPVLIIQIPFDSCKPRGVSVYWSDST